MRRREALLGGAPVPLRGLDVRPAHAGGPRRRLHLVLGRNPALLIQRAQLERRAHVPLLRRGAVPARGGDVVARDADTAAEQDREAELRFDETALGRGLQPARGFGRILRNAAPVGRLQAQAQLRLRIAALCRAAQPALRLARIDRRAIAGLVAASELRLRSHHALLRSLAIPANAAAGSAVTPSPRA